MESIIIFVLIAIASSVFQAVGQKNKQQKQAAPHTQASQPKVQPAASTVHKPNYTTQKTRESKSVAAVKETRVQSVTSMEGIQTEALEGAASLRDRKEFSMPEPSETIIDIAYDDLQKSIIMAEILGKPKALKKTRL